MLVAACGGSPSALGDGDAGAGAGADGGATDAGGRSVCVEGLEVATLRYGEFFSGSKRYAYTTGTRELAGSWASYSRDAGRWVRPSGTRVLTSTVDAELVGSDR